MFRGSVKGTGYPLHLPVSTSLPLPCVTVCHHVSTGLYITQRISIPAMYTTKEFKYSEVTGRFFVVGLQFITLLTDSRKARESQCTWVRHDVNTKLSIGEEF